MSAAKGCLPFILSLCGLLLVAGIVFFINHGRPAALFWDENYHIASAQKYVSGVMFMEPHPPLGKQLIALGETLFGGNEKLDTTTFLATDYIGAVPEGFSFGGVRFFPALFAVLSAALVFLVLHSVFRDWKYALLFSALFVFDNALVVHLRGAMLEGIQLFFILAALLVFLRAVSPGHARRVGNYMLLGLMLGLACAVKVNAAVLFLLFGFFTFEDLSLNFSRPGFRRTFPFVVLKNADTIPCKPSALLRLSGRIALKLAAGVGAALVAFLIPFYIHFALGARVVEDRFYQASAEYREISNDRQVANPLHFPVMFRDYLAYMDQYQKGVPKLDLTKAGENGSPAAAWPVGYKSINYRWDSDGAAASYLYLQINPVVWYACLAGLILALVFILGRVFFKTTITDRPRFRLIVYFSLLYLSYMAIMAAIPRVMYLYHYFIPLVFTMVLLTLVFRELFRVHFDNKSRLLFATTAAFALLVILVFLFFSPFTYYLPLDTRAFMQRVWTDIWGLVPVTQ